MVCNHCGAPLESGMKVCPHCGYISDSDGTSPERTTAHRTQNGRNNARNRDAFMAATSSAHTSADRAMPVRADGHPCLYCGTIIPDNETVCPKCKKAVSGKLPSISGAMPPVHKTPRQAYEARTGQTHTRASVAATAAYAAMAQKMGYDTTPRQITGEIPPVSQGSGKIPPVAAQSSGKIPPVAQGSGSFPAITQDSGSLPPVPQGSGSFPPVSQDSGKIPPISQGSGSIPHVTQNSGRIPTVSQNSGKIPPVAGAAATAPMGEPLPETNTNTNPRESLTSGASADTTAILPIVPPSTSGSFTPIADANEAPASQANADTAADKNPYAGAHAKSAGNPATGTAGAKKHPTKAKTPLSTAHQQTVGVAPITSRDLTNEQQRSKRKSAIGVGIITCVLVAGVGIGAWWFNGGDEKQRLVDYIETLGSFGNQGDNSNSTTSPFGPNDHTNTGGTATKALDDNDATDSNKDKTSDTKTDKTNKANTSKTTTDKDDKDTSDDEDNNNSTSSTKKPTITNTTDASHTSSNTNRNPNTSSNNTSSTNQSPETSNNNYGSTQNGTNGSNSNSSSNAGSNSNTSIWPDDLNNPPYQYYPPNPGNSGGSNSWGSGNSNGGSWGGNGSWNGGSGTNGGGGSYVPPLGELETEADKKLKADLEAAKARVEDYILPESADRDILIEELNKLTDFELYLARNEIYARHGRIFNVKPLDEYFNTRKWYDGKYTGVIFDTMVNVLNEFEIRNAELIKEIERERNSPYLSE